MPDDQISGPPRQGFSMKRTGIPGELPMSSTLATSIASAPIRTSAVKASPIGTGPSTTAFRGPLAKHAVPGGGHARKQPLGSGFAAGEEPGSWASDDAGGDEPSDYDLNHPYYADDGDDEPFSDQDADLVSDSDSNGDGEENASHAPEAHPADAQNFDPDDDHDRQAGDSNSGAEVRSQKPKAAEAGHASPPKKDAPKATRRKRDALKASVVPDHLRQTATGRAYNLVRHPGGAFSKSSGTLFPEKYEKGSVSSSLPWVCPIRSCRLLFKIESALAKHWLHKHKNVCLSDNRDGTFSVLGRYSRKVYKVLLPAIVTSWDPVGLDESPIEAPCPKRTAFHGRGSAAARNGPQSGKLLAPDRIRRMVHSSRNSVAPEGPGRAHHARGRSPSPFSETRSVSREADLPSPSPSPESDDDRITEAPVKHARTKGRRGTLPLQDPRNKCRFCACGNNFCEDGDRETNTPCERCRKTGRICSWDLQGRKVRWSHKAWDAFRPNESYRAEEVMPHGSPQQPPTLEAALSDVVLPEEPSLASRKRPWRTSVPDTEVGESADDEGSGLDDAQPPAKRGKPLETRSHLSEDPPGPSRYMVTMRIPKQSALAFEASQGGFPLPGPPPSRPAGPGALGSPAPRRPSPSRPALPQELDGDKEMELQAWEIDVGLFGSSHRGRTPLPPSKGAVFSQQYLTSRREPVHTKVDAHVEAIETGTTYTIEATPNRVHTCVVKEGKLRVRFCRDEGSGVIVGPGGLVSLLPTDYWCTMTNISYFSAVLYEIVSNVGGG